MCLSLSKQISTELPFGLGNVFGLGLPQLHFKTFIENAHVKLLRLNENFTSSSFGHQKNREKQSMKDLP